MRCQRRLYFWSSMECTSSFASKRRKGREDPILSREHIKLTHDYLVAAMRKWVSGQLGDALDPRFQPGTNPSVNWSMWQTTLMVCASFGSGGRGAEMVNLRMGDLVFVTEALIQQWARRYTKPSPKRGSETLRRIIFPSWNDTLIISPAFSLLTQLSLVHGIHSGDQSNTNSYAFPSVHRNQFQTVCQCLLTRIAQQLTSCFRN